VSICYVHDLGLVEYSAALEQQNAYAAARSQPDGVDRLLLVQHPPVYTLGTSGKADNLLWDAAERQRRGVAVHRVDRGGDVTFHGPGQLVGYPILQLPHPGDPGFRSGAVGHVRAIEQTIIDLLADYAIAARSIAGITGVWVTTPDGAAAKICAIGVRVNVKAVTKHGFALNLNTDLSYFDGIIPCGIRDKGVTSLARLLGQPVAESPVRDRLLAHFARVFGRELIMSPASPSPVG